MIDAPAARPDLPTGTVTFLRTDVEGSMGLARTLGPRWDEINATHLELLQAAVERHGGVRVRTEGDALFAAFPEAGAAVRAAIEGQRAMAAHAWPEHADVRVRMGLHSGEAHLAGDDYGGFEVNRAARIAAAGHGGQILISEPTRLLAETAIGREVTIRDLGRHVLRDVPAPERLYQLDIPGLQATFPPLRTSRPTAGNLPMRLTSFLGRDLDLTELDALLGANRLVTLTGPGGIGKTSLAIELGRGWQDRVPDGVWFVGLEAIDDPAMVRPEIARSLGLFDGPDRPAADGLDHYVADRSMVLVVDNFEHVLKAAGDVTAILRASPGTRVIATSRAPLRLPGEQEYPVRTLADPDASQELFTQRARAVRPGWDPGPDRGVLDEICSMLDGLPLGLELAAARISLLPLAAIRDRLAARLPLPGSGPRDVPQRQRTLESTIAWSHDLLTEEDQRLLHDLAVFEGSFDVEQAAQVSGGDVIEGLGRLAEQSLVTGFSDPAPAGVRYRMLQTIKRYALDRLVEEGREADLRRRHAQAYLALLARAAPHLPGGDQAAWLARLGLDHANLRAATRWAVDAGDVPLALQLVAKGWRFWQLAGHLTEGDELTDAALAMSGAEAPTLARVEALAAGGGIAYWRGDMPKTVRLYEAQRDLAIQLGDKAGEADAHYNLLFAINMGPRGELAPAEAAMAFRLFEELGDERGLARAIWARATLKLNAGDARGAIPLFEEAIAAFKANGDAWYHALGVGSLSWCYFALDDSENATRAAVQSLVEFHAMRDVATTTITLAPTARVALDAGRLEDAAILLAAFHNLCEVYGVQPPIGVLHLIAGGDVERRIADALGADTYAQATDRGRRLSLDEAVDLSVRICALFLGNGQGQSQ
jgi:predicted ATPase/class 3 adenylate cyclase